MASDDDDLTRAVNAQPFQVARSWTLFACEAALQVWDALTPEIDFEYRDSVVGMTHRIDPRIASRTLSAIAEERESAALAKEWREPITALQDDDWGLPEPALMAFYACYHAMHGASDKAPKHFVTSILQARNALRAFHVDVLERFQSIWSAWWARCASLGGVRPPPYDEDLARPQRPDPVKELSEPTLRLSEPVESERFEAFAVAFFGALGIPIGDLRRERRSVIPQSSDIESVDQMSWTDGTHTFELRHVWEAPRSMESRDHWDEATIDVPELGARIDLIGADGVGRYTILAERALVGRIRAAAHRAALGHSAKPRLPADGDLLHAARTDRHELFASAVGAGSVALDGQDDRGYTALSWAAQNGRWRSVRALLALGADPNVADDNGATPLVHAVCQSREGREEMVTALLQAGARVNRPDDLGRTALMRVGSPGGASIVRLLLEAHALVDDADVFGRTALHHYADGGRAEEAAVLLDKWQTKIDARDDEGNTPLHVAAARFHGSPDYTGDGTSPGSHIESSHLQVVRLLVERGARVSARNALGETPLDRAAKAENEAIAAFLRSNSAK